jgi:TolB-like protein
MIVVALAVWKFWVGPAPLHVRSIAVLPLQNLSNNPDQEYFSDATTEALISNLAQVHALGVISRTSVMRYKGTKKSIPEISRELGVDAIVEGSVQRSGGRVRITAQLIEGATDRHLWARNYERDVADILTTENEIATTIVREIEAQLTPEEKKRLAVARKVDPEAQDAFRLGRYYYWKNNGPDLERAVGHLVRAINLQPDYAPAYAWLAMSWLTRENFGYPRADAIATARTALKKGLELDPNVPEAHTALAYIRTQEWDWAGADEEFRKATDLNPDSLENCGCYASFLVGVGRLPEALAKVEHAAAINPLSSIIQFYYGLVFYYSRKYVRRSPIFDVR